MIVTVTLNPSVDETLVVKGLQVGETNRIIHTEIDPGGKGLNVARMVRRLGRPAVNIALVGGSAGTYIRHQLAEEGVNSDFVEIEHPTRVNISVFDEESRAQTNLNQPGPTVSARDLHGVEAKINEWLPEMVVLAIGGSLPPGAPADTYVRLIDWVTRVGVKTLLDTSGEALAEGVKAKPYMIKPNLRETQMLLGRQLASEADVISAGEQILEMGIEVAVISLGRDGAVAVSHKGVWKALPPPVQPTSTIGAGDSMVAGLVIGIAEHMSLDESLALGTAAGSATVESQGTQLGSAERIWELLPRVEVVKIE